MALSSFVVVFSPVLPTRFIPGRMRQPSDDARTAPITLGSRLKSSREKAAWRWGARGRKKARRRENVKNSVWQRRNGRRPTILSRRYAPARMPESSEDHLLAKMLGLQ